MSKQESKNLQQEGKWNKVPALSYIKLDAELGNQNEAGCKQESSESCNDDVIMTDEEEEPDINDDT